MKNPYEQFFKNARQARQSESQVQKKSVAPMLSKKPDKRIRKNRASLSFGKLIGPIFGVVIALFGYLYFDKVESYLSKVEFYFLGSASAQEKTDAPATGSIPAETATTSAKTETQSLKTESADHLSKLNDRKKELDAREEELNRMEAELVKQKEEMENRLKELDTMRGKISGILEDRVKIDEQRVENLVQMYSTMKAPQAAKIFETLDEDLAIEILSRMKKKNAADIMNLVKPEKAQLFSEKYAGYKRK